MSFTSTSRRMPFYTGNGTASDFSYNFLIHAATDLRVIVVDPDREATELELDVDFEVSGVRNSSGGDVSLIDDGQAWLTAGKLTTGWLLLIIGRTSPTQTISIRNQARDLIPARLEDGYDKLTMLVQELLEQVDRAVKIPVIMDIDDFDTDLPDQPEANRMLMIGPTGAGFALGPTPEELSEAAANLTATEAARDEALAAQAAAEAAQAAAEAAATAADASADAAAASELAASASASAAGTAETNAETAQAAAEAAAATLAAITTGGTTGQVLKKLSNADGHYGWANESGGGGGPAGTPDQGSLAGTYAAGNTTYTLPNAPLEPMALLGWLGGVFQVQDVHYTLSGTTITVTGEDTSAENFNYFMRH